MKLFIQKQQEEALKELQGYLNDWAITEPEISLILGNVRRMFSQVVQNTVEEIGRMVEAMEKLPDKNFGEGELRHNYEYNQALTQVQSLLKDITTES